MEKVTGDTTIQKRVLPCSQFYCNAFHYYYYYYYYYYYNVL